MSLAAGCLLRCGPVVPDQPRCPAFARAGVAAHAACCCGGCNTPSQGTAGGAPAEQPGAAA